MSGSLATSSSRYPGGNENVFSASVGERTGASLEIFPTPGGQDGVCDDVRYP